MKKSLALLVCLLVAFFFWACSLRPENITVILDNHQNTGDAGQSGFQPKEAYYHSISNKLVAGWQGDQLLVYDVYGAYLVNPSTGESTVCFETDGDPLMYLTVSEDGKHLCYLLGLGDPLLQVYLADTGFKNSQSLGYIESMANSDAYYDIYFLEELAPSLSDSSGFWSTDSKILQLPDLLRNPHTGTPYLLDTDAEAILDQNAFDSLERHISSVDLLDIQDATDEFLFFPYSEETLYVSKGQSAEPLPSTFQYGNMLKASFLGENGVVYLSGNTMGILRRDLPGQAKIYTVVGDYALSADRSFICFTKLSDQRSYDLYLAQCKEGIVLSESLIFKDFLPDQNGIFFSPDGQNICIQGKKGTVAASYSASTGAFEGSSEKDVLILHF
ncbi:MAG: hypothetical protein ACOYI4_00710 [Christensenellales bacterium]|jgi:hypothetical protein